MDPPRDVVRAARIDHALVVTLDNPPVNVLSRTVLDALSARLEEAESDPEVRVVVLASAAEKAFAAGANIREMAPMGPSEAFEHGTRGQNDHAEDRAPSSPCHCRGARGVLRRGMRDRARVRLHRRERGRSIRPARDQLGSDARLGRYRRLPRRIGAARARRWILTAARSPPRRPRTPGSSIGSCPGPNSSRPPSHWPRSSRAKPPLALAAAKFALLHAIDPEMDRGLAYERGLWAQLFGTEGQKEGMRAFLTKERLAPRSRADWEASSAGFPWAKDSRGSESIGKRKNAEVSIVTDAPRWLSWQSGSLVRSRPRVQIPPAADFSRSTPRGPLGAILA